LRAGGIGTIAVCGLATNICCFYAARDLRREGFRVLIVEDASAGIDVPAAGLFQEKAKREGQQAGIEYVTTAELLAATE
jgi:nicotinamidase/pyrazinamidase